MAEHDKATLTPTEYKLAQQTIGNIGTLIESLLAGSEVDLDAFIRMTDSSVSHNEAAYPITVARGMPVPDLDHGLAQLRAFAEAARGLRQTMKAFAVIRENCEQRDAMKAAGVLL